MHTYMRTYNFKTIILYMRALLFCYAKILYIYTRKIGGHQKELNRRVKFVHKIT
jgi:hypothetical protein